MGLLFPSKAQIKERERIKKLVLGKIQVRIGQEVEKPNGLLTAESLGKLKKEIYG